MSTGETPATPRFTSPSSTTTKKYPGTPKSPLVNNSTNATTNTSTNNSRNSLARQRLLSSKISAPRPMNLPSLRREHASGTEVPASSPSTSHGWGSSTSSSPSNSFTQQEIPVSPEQQPISPTIESTTQDVDPKVDLSTTTTTRAWNVPTTTTTVTQSTDFPTAAEAAAGKKKPLIYDDKEYLKYASHDPNHTSWDEMVSEDLDDFSVDVVEFDDGTKVQIEGETTKQEELVNPSDRFTEDYDRSYPPSNNKYQQYRRSEDHGYNNSRYNNSVHGYDNRRHSNTSENKWMPRRESVDSNHSNNRRTSYDRNPSSLLQRPRRLSEQSFKSDHSREDTFHFEQHHSTNPLHIIPEPPVEEITAVQKEVMLTAAERAKKRRDEEEAEFEAARVRARQKADALAEKARLANPIEKEVLKKPVQKRDSISSSTNSTKANRSSTTSSLPDTSKPWNLVAAKKEITIEKRPIVNETPKVDPPKEEQPKEEQPKEEITKGGSSLITPKPKPSSSESIVEVFEYNDMEEMGNISSQLKNKGQYRGWTRHDEEHGGGRGERHNGRGRGIAADRGRGGGRKNVHTRRQSENTNWRQSNPIEHEKEQPITVVTEILKHEPVVKQSKKTRLINLLKESSSPIFPESIQKLVGKKPANISFMIHTDESDKDITMMDVEEVEEENIVESVEATDAEVFEVAEDKPEALEEANVPETVEATSVPEAVDETSATSSTTSTPPRTQFQQNGHTKLDSSSPRRLNMNPNFPVLVYQYPMSQQQQQETNSHSNGYHSRSKGLHQQQRPMGVYLMPPQQYITSNQYMVPYSQVGTGVQPVYYPTMSWPTQQYNNNNRPPYEQRRSYNNTSYNKSPTTNNNNNGNTSHMSEWEAIANSSGYQSQRFAHSFPNSHSSRGSYRGKRGGNGWFNSNHRGGRGHYQSKRYPQQDVNNTTTATDL